METYARQMVFAGTTNRDDWHVDDTGGRRYAPVKCLDRIDLDWIAAQREQLFAEALALYGEGHAWWELPEEQHRRALAEQQAHGAHDNTIAGWIARSIRDGTLWTGEGCGLAPQMPDVAVVGDLRQRWGNLMMTDRVIVQWLGFPMESVVRHRQEIGATLRRMGWETSYRRFDGGTPLRHWVLREALQRGAQGALELVSNSERDTAAVSSLQRPEDLPDDPFG